MKKALLFCLILVFLLLSGCGAPTRDAPVTERAEHVSEPETVQQVEYNGTPANDTLGKVTAREDGMLVEDASVLYRTEDSYRFEPAALEAARDSFEKTLSAPQTLELQRATVWDCADDSESVYYSVHLDGSYIVESGERISSGYFCDVGIRKSDGAAFDAGQQISRIVDAYSVFRPQVEGTDEAIEDTDPIRAAEKIALSRLKNPEQGRLISSAIVGEDADVLQIEALCSGVNDYDMQIPCVYTVYLQRGEDTLYEWSAD